MVVHARRMLGHVCVETPGGPYVDEEYGPLCNVSYRDEVQMTDTRDWEEKGCTCGRCLRMLRSPAYASEEE